MIQRVGKPVLLLLSISPIRVGSCRSDAKVILTINAEIVGDYLASLQELVFLLSNPVVYRGLKSVLK